MYVTLSKTSIGMQKACVSASAVTHLPAVFLYLSLLLKYWIKLVTMYLFVSIFICNYFFSGVCFRSSNRLSLPCFEPRISWIRTVNIYTKHWLVRLPISPDEFYHRCECELRKACHTKAMARNKFSNVAEPKSCGIFIEKVEMRLQKLEHLLCARILMINVIR